MSMNIGGQAVIEGVMMRSPHRWAVAVRRPDGRIALLDQPWRSWSEKLFFLKWPFFRGGVVLAESMSHGIRALLFSSREALPEDERPKEGEGEGISTTLALVLGLVMAIVLFKFVPHFTVLAIGWAFGINLTPSQVVFHLLDGLIKMIIFVAYVALIGRLQDIRRLYMYHGAEHKVIFSYEREKKLSVESASRQGRLHPRCGTAFLVVVIISSIIVYSLVLPFVPRLSVNPWIHQTLLVVLKILFLFPIAGAAYEFNRFAGRHTEHAALRPLIWPGLAVQRITTSDPTEDQIEVALVSLGAVLRSEERFGQAQPRSGPSPDGGEEPRIFESYRDAAEALWEAPSHDQESPDTKEVQGG